MKHPDDIRTAELPGIPSASRRGRKSLLGRPMTAAERKRRSRSQKLARAMKDHHLRLPKALSVEIDASLHQRLKNYCTTTGKTQIEVLEMLLMQLPEATTTKPVAASVPDPVNHSLF